MKIAVSSYSFQKYLASKEISQIDSIKIAKDMGYDAIEFAEVSPHDGSSIEEYAAKLKEMADKNDFVISNLAVGGDFLNCPLGSFEAEIANVKRMVDVAAILGVKTMRHDCTAGYSGEKRGHLGFDDVLPILADACRQVTEYAETKGIRTMVENHGFFCQDSDRIEKLVNAVAHKNFGALVDFGNFLCADENPVIAVSRVAPYAFYAHAKDFHVKSGMCENPGGGFFMSRGANYLRGAIIGHGDVPVKQCLKILKNAGYDGYITVEFEGIEENYMALNIALENMRRYIEAI